MCADRIAPQTLRQHGRCDPAVVIQEHASVRDLQQELLPGVLARRGRRGAGHSTAHGRQLALDDSQVDRVIVNDQYFTTLQIDRFRWQRCQRDKRKRDLEPEARTGSRVLLTPIDPFISSTSGGRLTGQAGPAKAPLIDASA